LGQPRLTKPMRGRAAASGVTELVSGDEALRVVDILSYFNSS
jgi:hypothetical protein